MTIQFNCPNCDAVIAFDDKHRGKRARCTTCGQRFVIPLEGEAKPTKVKPPKEEGETLPGFYRAVFFDSYKLFTVPESVTPLVLIATVVCCKFFVANCNYTMTVAGEVVSIDLPIPIGHVLHIAAWGFLLWYYMEIIYSTAFDQETLPEAIVGGLKGFVGLIARSLYMCFVALLVVGLPLIVYVVISETIEARWSVLFYVLIGCGVFLLPMALVTLAVGKDLAMLRPDRLVITISRTFRSYLVTAVLLGVAGAIQTQASQHDYQDTTAAAGYLLLNLTVQVFALVAARSIGLFHRHYNSYFAW